MRRGRSRIGICDMFGILNDGSVAPVYSHFDVYFIVPQSYFRSDISVLMKVSFEPVPSLRANDFPSLPLSGCTAH